MPKSSGHPTSSRTHWLGSRPYSPPTASTTGLFQTGLWMHFIWIDSTTVPKPVGSDPSPRSSYYTWSISYFTCSKSPRGITWTITVFSSFKTVSKYFTKLKSHPDNPAYSCVFEPLNVILFEASPTKIPPLDLRLLSHLEKSGIILGLIDDVSVLSTAPWTLPVPSVRL